MSSPEERFNELFEQTHQALLGYAVRRVADPADAADVVAETFLVAWRRIDEVPTAAEAKPWMFGVARNVLANYYRGERRRHALDGRLRDQLTTELARPAPTHLSLALAMDQLPQGDRELLRLVAWEGLARDEIAMVLRVPRATVRVRLHRARKRLLTLLEDVEAEADGGRPPIPELVLPTPRALTTPMVRRAEEIS